MSQVQNNSSVSELLASNSGSIKSYRKDEEDPQDRFLKLLVTQMQNQDPLKPMDNAEVTSQMAQISTVSGIDKLNTTLEKLVADSDARRSFEAATMIGRGVLVPGTDMQLENQAAIGGFELAESVDK
ncbi:MAG TPA: flagellar hook capping FlgD N-terminal domain-containing protein, partial [Nitrosomonas europaea]